MSKPSLKSLRGDYQIPENVKMQFGLSTLLKANASCWTDPVTLIDSYFVNCLIWEATGGDYLRLLSEGLIKFSKSNRETQKVRSYAEGVAQYISRNDVIEKCRVYYNLKATEADAKRQEVLARIQGNAAGAALSNAGALNIKKRAFEDVFPDEEEEEEEEEKEEEIAKLQDKEDINASFTINQFEIHTPSRKHFISPKKPILKENDRIVVSEYFDFRISSDIEQSCSDALSNEYNTHMSNQKKNTSLKYVLGSDSLEFIKELCKIKLDKFSYDIFTLQSPNHVFVDFIKQSYNDLCVVWNSPQDYSQAGERTLFSEIFISQFKLFSKMTKLLHFKWIEKKLTNTDHSWMVKKDFIKKDVQLKFLDGVGIMNKNKINFLMIESSGVAENLFDHTLEDTLKNLKHGTDSLSSILCEYKDSSYKTAKRIAVLTGHVIQNKLTIIKYSVGDAGKWAAVETRSCTVPLEYESRSECVKLFEAFAYIYLTLKEQEVVYDDLTNEKLGLVEVQEKDMVRNSTGFL